MSKENENKPELTTKKIFMERVEPYPMFSVNTPYAEGNMYIHNSNPSKYFILSHVANYKSFLNDLGIKQAILLYSALMGEDFTDYKSNKMYRDLYFNMISGSNIYNLLEDLNVDYNKIIDCNEIIRRSKEQGMVTSERIYNTVLSYRLNKKFLFDKESQKDFVDTCLIIADMYNFLNLQMSIYSLFLYLPNVKDIKIKDFDLLQQAYDFYKSYVTQLNSTLNLTK